MPFAARMVVVAERHRRCDPVDGLLHPQRRRPVASLALLAASRGRRGRHAVLRAQSRPALHADHGHERARLPLPDDLGRALPHGVSARAWGKGISASPAAPSSPAASSSSPPSTRATTAGSSPRIVWLIALRALWRHRAWTSPAGGAFVLFTAMLITAPCCGSPGMPASMATGSTSCAARTPPKPSTSAPPRLARPTIPAGTAFASRRSITSSPRNWARSRAVGQSAAVPCDRRNHRRSL